MQYQYLADYCGLRLKPLLTSLLQLETIGPKKRCYAVRAPNSAVKKDFDRRSPLANHPIGPSQYRVGNLQVQCFSGFTIEHEFEFGRFFDG